MILYALLMALFFGLLFMQVVRMLIDIVRALIENYKK